MFVSGGDLTMRHVTFERTFASFIGGGIFAARGQLTLYHADFINTIALTQAHAMHVQDAARVIAALVTFRNHMCNDGNWMFGIMGTHAPVALRNATFDTPGCLLYRATLRIPTCSDAALDLPSWLPRVCGNEAKCTDVQHWALVPIQTGGMQGANVTIPTCDCASPTFPSHHATSPVLAPYQFGVRDGCVAPLHAYELTHRADKLTERVVKRHLADDSQAWPITTVVVRGTAWTLFEQGHRFPWRVLDANPTPWLRAVEPSGYLVAGPGDSVANVPLHINVTGLRERAEAYRSNISIAVDLPVPGQEESGQMETQHVSMDVAVIVTARPVASQMTLVDPGLLRVAIRTESSFGFEVRDLDGLLIMRNRGDYEVQLVRCEDCAHVETCSSCRSNRSLPVVYAGGGRHDVLVNVKRLGMYRATVEILSQEGWHEQEKLPFDQMIEAVCGRYHYDDMAEPRSCQPCPEGMTGCAQQGITLETLPLKGNYWRSSNRTRDIRDCTTRIDSRVAVTSPCIGGNHSNYCRPGHRGPLCRVCVGEAHYYSQGQCWPCEMRGRWAFVVVILVVLSCLLGWKLMVRSWRYLSHAHKHDHAWSQSDRLRRLLKFIRDVHILMARTQFVDTLIAKLKICVVHFQVVLLLTEVYDVPLPLVWHETMQVFDVMRFDWLNIVVNEDCIGHVRTRGP